MRSDSGARFCSNVASREACISRRDLFSFRKELAIRSLLLVKRPGGGRETDDQQYKSSARPIRRGCGPVGDGCRKHKVKAFRRHAVSPVTGCFASLPEKSSALLLRHFSPLATGESLSGARSFPLPSVFVLRRAVLRACVHFVFRRVHALLRCCYPSLQAGIFSRDVPTCWLLQLRCTTIAYVLQYLINVMSPSA